MRGEKGSSCATCEDRDRRERTDGDQNGAEGGHGLWMLGGQEVQSVGGVQKPDWHVCDGSDGWQRETRGISILGITCEMKEGKTHYRQVFDSECQLGRVLTKRNSQMPWIHDA